MKNKYKYLLNNIFLFSISSFVPKLLAFILIPIYTSYLSTADYGISDLISTTVSLLIPIFTIDIQDAVLVFSMDKNTKTEDVLNIALRINFIGFIIILIGTTLTNYFNLFNVSSYIYIFFLISYISNSLLNSLTIFCKGINKVKTNVVSSIINSTITLLLNIILLKFCNFGIIGYLIANTTGLVISLFYIFIDIRIYRYFNLSCNNKLFREMIKFSFPLVFSALAWWINNASDRYILSWMMGVSVSGLYAISYKIPSLLTIIQNIFSQAWSISAIKEFDKNDCDSFIGNLFTILNFTMVFACSIIMVFNVPIAKMLYSDSFFYAWKFVPPLLLSVVFNALSLFIGSIFTTMKDTKTLSISTIVGALINTILNVILIKHFGAYGAAIATFIGYLVVFNIRNILLRRYVVMKTNYKINTISYLLLFIQMIVAFFGSKYYYIQLLISFTFILLYKGCIIDILKTLKKLLSREGKKQK